MVGILTFLIFLTTSRSARATEEEVCHLPLDKGPCTDFQLRWYFDYEIGYCRVFVYRGCEGNGNNFGSQPECEKRCGRVDQPEPPTTTDFTFQTATEEKVCHLPRDKGPCTDFQLRWYFDYEIGYCRVFVYGGCEGNGNNFGSQPECEKRCGLVDQPEPPTTTDFTFQTASEEGVCHLPSDKGPCTDSLARWYFDYEIGYCLFFVYGGCEGNGNNFGSRSECEKRCGRVDQPKTPTTTDFSFQTDVCSLPKDRGPCLEYFRSWWYDASEDACKGFIYGGCEGNGNRFDQRKECEQRCVGKKIPQDTCANLECSQKCETTSHGPRCYCNDGFELDDRDNKTCNGIEDSEFIFFNEGSNVYIKKRKAGYELFIDLLPLPSRMGRISGLSFQPNTQVLYIADGEGPRIYAVNMSNAQERDLVRNHLSSPEDVAFDWMSNNLYWVDADKGTTEVISVDTMKRIVLIEDLSKPVSLAISPYSGIMFIAEVGFDAWISMFEMDGTNKRILHSVQGLPMSLTLHPSKTLLYWSDIREEIISYVNYSSTSPPRTLKRVAGIMSVAASEDSIFFTTEEIQRERTTTEKVQEMKLIEYGKVKTWKSITYSYGMKPSRKSECLIENGGCGFLCLTSPKGRTCACSSAMKLDKDGRTCLGKICEKNDFRCLDGQCIPAGMKCDGNIECNDGSDEQNCEDHTITP